MTTHAVRRANGATVGRASAPVTPLRALRHQPALVDDRAAARLLAAGTSDALSPESVRWARAWLVCSQAVVAAEPGLGAEESSSLAFDPGQVAAPKGLGDAARQSAVLAALLAAGVLRATAGAEAGRVSWAADICAVHSAAVTIDWPGVVSACGREPAALLVVRTLAEYVVPAHSWTVVPRRDLVERTSYMQKQVRVALRRLEAAGIIDAEGETGRTARYRFTEQALAPRWEQPSVVGPSLVASDALAGSPETRVHPAGSAPVMRPSHPTPAVRESARAQGAGSPSEQGVEVVIGGVTVRMAPGTSLDVGAGARAEVVVGPDGRMSLTVVPS